MKTLCELRQDFYFTSTILIISIIIFCLSIYFLYDFLLITRFSLVISFIGVLFSFVYILDIIEDAKQLNK